MVPIAFQHAPTPTKPSRKASPGEWEKYRHAARLARIPLRASQQIASLPLALDAEPYGSQRPLHLFVDGGYTNGPFSSYEPRSGAAAWESRSSPASRLSPPPNAKPEKFAPDIRSAVLYAVS